MKQTKVVQTRNNRQVAASVERPDERVALLQVDLWLVSPLSESLTEAPAQNNVPPSAIGMISDLIKAVHGEILRTDGTQVSASFPDTHRTVNSVRYLQRLIHGYSTSSATGPLSACFTIAAADDKDKLAEAARLNTDGARVQLEPRRALLIGSICAEAKSIPGLQFRDFFLSSPGTDNSVSRLSAVELLPPEQMSVFADNPNARRISTPAQPVQSAVPLVSAKIQQPGLFQKNLHTFRKGLGSFSVACLTTLKRMRFAFSATMEASLEGSKRYPRWMIFGVSSLVILLGVGGFVWIERPFSKTPSRSSGSATSGSVPNDNSISKMPQKQEDSANVAQDKPRMQHTDAAKPKEPLPVVTKPPKMPHDKGSPGSGGFYTPSEIANLIQEAQRLAGDGKYSEAIQRYDSVLGHDPGNTAAKVGRERAITKRNMAEQQRKSAD
jgi:hypothetical protein